MAQRDLEMTKRRIHDLVEDAKLRGEIPHISDAIREADSYAEKVTYEQSQRVEAIKSVMASLRGIGGRTAMVLFTDQLSTNPAMPAYDFIYRIKDQFVNGQSYFPQHAAARYNDTGVATRISEIANSSGITVYPVSASGLGVDLSAVSAENRGEYAAFSTPDVTHSEDQLMALHEIAAQTGGMALTQSNNFDLAFNTLTQDMISYYSLGYHTEGERKDAVRSISVKLKKKGYNVRSRSSFIERSLTSEMQDAVAANLLYPIAKNDLNVSMAKGGAPEPGTEQHVVVPVVVKIPTSNLTLIPDGTDLVGQFSSYTAFIRRDGKVSDVKRTQHQLRFPADSLKRRKEITVKYDLTIDDKTDGVSVGIMDDTSHVTGFATLQIQN
jgi:VWFA-related protein